MSIEHRGDQEEDERMNNTMSTQLIRRQLRDFINFSPAGGDENRKQAIKKNNGKGWQWQWRTCKENHGKLRHILPHCLVL